MERLKKVYLFLFIFIVTFVSTKQINGLTSYSGGHSGQSGWTVSGDYNDVNGLRIVVLDKNGNRKEGTHVVDVLNPTGEWQNTENYYALSDRKSLVEYAKNRDKNGKVILGDWNIKVNSGGSLKNDNYFYNVTSIGAENFHEFVQTGKVCNKYWTGVFDCSRRGGERYGNIKQYLESNEYANLKKILERTGYKCDINDKNSNCDESDYISVEILFQIMSKGERYVGTGFEIALDFEKSSGAQSRYKNTSKMLFLDKSVVPNNPLFGIYAVNSNDVDKYGLDKAYEALNDYSKGVGFSLYKVTDFIDIPKEYKVVVNKVSSTTKQPITSSTVVLKIHINSSDCDADGEEEVTFIERGNGQVIFNRIPAKFFDGKTSFSIEELEIPSGYLKTTESCVFKNGILNKNMETINIENTPGCVVEFNELTEAQKNDIDIRDSLFNKYKDIPSPNGGNFTNLYDLTKMKGVEVCTEAECDYPEFPGGSPGDDDSSYCMTGGIALQQEFNQRNMACFDNRLVDGDNRVVGLCSSKLIISRPIDIKTDTFHYIKKGLPIFITNYPIKQTIETTCYSFDGSYKDTYKLEKEYDNKNSTASLKYLGKEQINTKTSDYNVLKTYNNGYVFTSTINYYLKPIFLKIGIGTNNSSGGTNVYPGKYGIMSKSTDDLELSMYNFKKIDPEKFGIIKFTATLPLISSNESITLDGECKYSFKNSLQTGKKCRDENGKYYYKNKEVTRNEYINTYHCDDEPSGNGDLSIQFRTIDVNNPFPGKDGKSNRPIGSNWRGYCIPKSNTDSSCDYELNEQLIMFDLNKDGKISTSEARLVIQAADISNKMGVKLIETQFYYSFSDSGETNDIKLDLNDDGIVNDEDARLFERLDALKISVGTKGDNYIDAYIKNAVNSYGRDGSGDSKDPIYTLILTPSDIRQIRKYNSYTSYDDYISMNEEKCDEDNLSACDNEDTFRMKFIDGLKNGKLEFEKKSSLNLSNKLKVLEN